MAADIVPERTAIIFDMSTNNDNASPSNGDHGPPANKASNSSKTSSSSNLLLKMLEACARHKRRHEHERREPSSKAEEERLREQKCLGELNQFAAFLPRIEATVTVRDSYSEDYYYNPPREADEAERDTLRGFYLNKRDQTKLLRSENDADDAGNLCALYRAIARGSFCPKAVRYLFSNQRSKNNGEPATATSGRDVETKDVDLARGILPRVLKLLQFLALDPVRMALLPLKLPQSKKTKATMSQLGRHAVRAYYQDEDIGSTIASLLALLQSDHMRLAAVQDLINLSNDLNTIDESRALFHPPTSAEADNTVKEDQGNIRIRVFTEISSLFDANQDRGENAAFDDFIRIPSRRSLLALQCGVWVALQHLIPVVSDSLGQFGEDKSLVVLESARIALSSRSSFPESHFLGWEYTRLDLSLHSLLSLRMKLGIAGLLESMATTNDRVFQALGSDASLPPFELAIMAVEAVKFHLSRNQRNQSDVVEDHTHVEGDILQAARSLESDLMSLYSWALSNLLVSAVVSPDYALTSRDEIWLHCFPHVIDCIANMVDTCNKGDKSLGHVLMRLFHAILRRGRKTSNLAVLHLFQNRCLVRGFFSQLFDLANDSSEAISGPTISILIDLLTARCVGVVPENDVENSCSIALASIDNNDRMDVDAKNETSSIRLGSKRRRIENADEDSDHAIASTWSIQATFSHAIANALSSAHTIVKKLDAQNSRGSNIISFLSESDIGRLRCITGIVCILCSLRSQCCAIETFQCTDEVLGTLFRCIERVSDALTNPKSETGRMLHVEKHLLPVALSLVVNVGLHVCQLPNQDGVDLLDSSVRESMSNCALSSVSLIDDKQDTHTGGNHNEGVCPDCCSLGSIIEMFDIPASDCLCSLDDDANRDPIVGNLFTLQSR